MYLKDALLILSDGKDKIIHFICMFQTSNMFFFFFKFQNTSL